MVSLRRSTFSASPPGAATARRRRRQVPVAVELDLDLRAARGRRSSPRRPTRAATAGAPRRRAPRCARVRLPLSLVSSIGARTSASLEPRYSAAHSMSKERKAGKTRPMALGFALTATGRPGCSPAASASLRPPPSRASSAGASGFSPNGGPRIRACCGGCSGARRSRSSRRPSFGTARSSSPSSGSSASSSPTRRRRSEERR